MKKRLLYISSITPDTSSGAHLAIYRHLILRNDFELAVAGLHTDTVVTPRKYNLKKSVLGKRISNTRFSRYYYNLKYFLNWYYLPKGLVKFAHKVKPDCIFTVPDNIHSGLALQLAKKLQVPIVIDFQDLFPLSRFIPDFMKPFEFTRKFLLKKFFKLNEVADYVFYTSEGMKNYFPAKSRSAVLYPLGDSKKKELEVLPHYQNKEFTIVYAGNCYGAYGRMLLKLAKAIKVTPGIHLKIFPVGKGWSEEDIKEMTEAGIYKSFLPFPELQLEFAKADAFLTVMSFEEPEKPFVSTSFTTKWLDYAAYGKPVITWSPEYSSSNVFASQHQSAVIIDVDDPMKVIEKILLLSKEEIAFYSCKSNKISAELFNPDTIHEVFLKGIYNAISTN